MTWFGQRPLFAGWGTCESIVRIPARWLSSEHLLAGGNFLLDRPNLLAGWNERRFCKEAWIETKGA